MTPTGYIAVPSATIDRLEHLGKGLLNLAEGMRRIARPIAGVKPAKTVMPLPVLKRPAHVPKDQEWFWTEEWQAGEREVNEALARGEYKEFNTIDELLADLHGNV